MSLFYFFYRNFLEDSSNIVRSSSTPNIKNQENKDDQYLFNLDKSINWKGLCKVIERILRYKNFVIIPLKTRLFKNLLSTLGRIFLLGKIFRVFEDSRKGAKGNFR